MEMTGAQILLECLKEQGVDTIFGYPGGAVLNIYDELYRQQDEIRHILPSHEQGAAHAADGYARSTGKVGVCLATSGPGATNLVTGIATAYMDSVPLVAITGNVSVDLLGKDSFQEVDIAGITMPITKHNFIVKDVKDLAHTIRRAFHIARKGRPGPVLVDIAKDVTAKKAEYVKEDINFEQVVKKAIKESEVNEAIKMIEEAKQPVIILGGGAVISDSQKEIIEFVKKVQAPVTDTLMAKGAFPGHDPLYMGGVGMHGTKTSNLAVTNCDLLIAIGSRFSDRVTGNTSKFANKSKILHIDIDPAEVNKNVDARHSIVGDIKEVLGILNERLEKQDHSDWINKIFESKAKYPLKYNQDVLTGPYILEKLYELTNGDAIITTGVGQHQMWSAQFYKYKSPRTFITSGGLGTMGFGLGASIGAQVGNPDKQVVNIDGDGCFRMTMNELATTARYNLPLVEIILNNGVLGMVRQWQDLFYDKRYSQTNLEDNVDFVKLAEAVGVKGLRITKVEEVEDVLKEALEHNGPVLIDCIIGKDDKVWPMVAAGAPIDEIITEEDINR
jgi:acetolactate synthase-1/2/3 large subunit